QLILWRKAHPYLPTWWAAQYLSIFSTRPWLYSYIPHYPAGVTAFDLSFSRDSLLILWNETFWKFPLSTTKTSSVLENSRNFHKKSAFLHRFLWISCSVCLMPLLSRAAASVGSCRGHRGRRRRSDSSR